MKQLITVWFGEGHDSPFGRPWLAVTEEGVVAISLWPDRDEFEAWLTRLTKGELVYDPGRVTAVAEQLSEYFRGERTEFTLPLDWSVMTPFQNDALREVYAIGYGRTSTYGEIAQKLGKPKAVRAVGRANATNPIPIIIPCHRVLGADGKLHGYGAPGGLETKAQLLQLEGSWLI